MKIISNSANNGPFDMLSLEHKNEILKYYNVETKEIKECLVAVGGSTPIPSTIHLNNLTSISYILNPKSVTKFDVNTFDIIIGIYTRQKMFSKIATGLILDNRNNTSSLNGMIQDLKTYMQDYRLFDSVGDKEKVKLFLTLGIGLTIEINSNNNFVNLKIGSELTNSIISDRSFVRYERTYF